MITPDKNVWGPILWSIMHILATKYKYNKQTQLFNIIFKKYIPNVIPCDNCLYHYNNFIKSNLLSPRNFAYNLYVFHDSVSKRNGINTHSNYQIYHTNYLNYNIKDVINLINKLKNYFITVGKKNNAQQLNYFIGLLKINYKILVI